MEPDDHRKPGELGFAALAFAGSLTLLYAAYGISGFSALSGPGSFPMAVALLMVVTSGAVLLRTLRLPPLAPGGRFFAQVLPPAVGGFCGMIAAYAAALDLLGFVLASALFLLGGFKFLHRGGWVRSVLMAVAALLVVYVVFRLVFQVILPEGILPEGEILAAIGRLFSEGAAR